MVYPPFLILTYLWLALKLLSKMHLPQDKNIFGLDISARCRAKHSCPWEYYITSAAVYGFSD